MDRFIELTLNAQKIFFDNLKSNMDRFKVISTETILYYLFWSNFIYHIPYFYVLFFYYIVDNSILLFQDNYFNSNIKRKN